MQKTILDKDSHNLLSIGEASEYLGISIDTLRRWEKKEKIKAYRSPGGHRYFKKPELDNLFGRKYEREKEISPRVTKNIKTLKQTQIKPQTITAPVKPSDIRVVTEREPRVINIPATQPISIISQRTETQTYVPEDNIPQRTVTKEYNVQHSTTSPPPPPPGPEALRAGGIPPQQKSILEAPNLKPQSPQQSQIPIQKKSNNMVLIIVVSVVILLIIAFTIFVILTSNQEVLSPIP